MSKCKPTPSYDRPNSLWLTSLLTWLSHSWAARGIEERQSLFYEPTVYHIVCKHTNLLSLFSCWTPLQAFKHVPTRLRCKLLFNTSLYTKRKSTLLTKYSLTVTVGFNWHTQHTSGSGEARSGHRQAKQQTLSSTPRQAWFVSGHKHITQDYSRQTGIISDLYHSQEVQGNSTQRCTFMGKMQTCITE